MKPFICESPNHFDVTGTVDRVVRDITDQFTVSLDMMRKDNQDRHHRINLNDARTLDGRRIGPQRVCKKCADAWYEACYAKAADQGEMF